MKKVDIQAIRRVPSAIKRIPYNKVLVFIVGLIVLISLVYGGRYIYVHKFQKKRDVAAEQIKTNEKLVSLAEKKDCKALEKEVKKTNANEDGFALTFQYYLGVGDCYYSIDNKTTADKYYKKALVIAESVKDSDAIEVAKNKLQPKTETKPKDKETNNDTVL